jgi:isoquinoline 1-oxidoreductase beta subunit
MTQVDDLRHSLIAFEQSSTLVIVVELSQSSWLVAGVAPGIERASLWGLSMALHEGSEFVNGQPKDTNLDSYTPLRIGDIPEVEVEFLPSTEAPVGLGEPATTVVAPATANAIFAASGARVRHLPIRPDAILQALNARS